MTEACCLTIFQWTNLTFQLPQPGLCPWTLLGGFLSPSPDFGT